jgi:hypothetical protein
MFALSNKSKQYLLVALKVLILTFTFSYIYVKINQNDSINSFMFFYKTFTTKSIISILGFLCLAALNWFFEILKWKTIIKTIKTISFFTALKQSLASLTVSLATPNRVGEYGAKAYFFEKNNRKKVMLYNLYHNFFQMFITCFLGVIGLFLFFSKHQINSFFIKLDLKLIVMILFTILIVSFIFRNQTLIFKGLTISNLIRKLKEIPKTIKLKILLYSFIRYCIFCFLFFQLLHFFGAIITLTEAIPCILSMYLLASIIPTLSLFDVVIKGGVAVWLFSVLGVSDIIVLSTVFCMWILNFVFPSLIGAYFLITYKPTYE